MGQSFSVEVNPPPGKTPVPPEVIINIAREHIPSMPPPLPKLMKAVGPFNYDWLRYNEDPNAYAPFAAAPRIPEPRTYHNVRGNLGWVKLTHMSRSIRNALRTEGGEFWAASIGRLPNATAEMLALSDLRPLDVFVDLAPWRYGGRRVMRMLTDGTIPLTRIRSLTFIDVRVNTDPNPALAPLLAQMTALKSLDIYAALSEQGRGRVGPPPAIIPFPIPNFVISARPIKVSFTNFVARVNNITHLSIAQTTLGKHSPSWTVTRDELLDVLFLSHQTLETLYLHVELPGEVRAHARDPAFATLPARIHFLRLTRVHFGDFSEKGYNFSLVHDFSKHMMFRPDATIVIHGLCAMEGHLLSTDNISQFFGKGGLPPATFCVIDAAHVDPKSNADHDNWPSIRVHYSTSPTNTGLTFIISALTSTYRDIALHIDHLVDVAANFSPGGISLYAPHLSMPPHFRRLRARMVFSEEMLPDHTKKYVWHSQPYSAE
ncbi:unnamed protein product [Peniophora sp. CBMAI 1063]|nr:unnamed protein product [Peniophora sp. CBMAI 1063]